MGALLFKNEKEFKENYKESLRLLSLVRMGQVKGHSGKVWRCPQRTVLRSTKQFSSYIITCKPHVHAVSNPVTNY